jgi:hypothetical protein
MSARARRLVCAAGTIVPLACLATAASAVAAPGCGHELTVPSGSTYVVSTTTCLRRLTVEPGATVTAPSGDSLTLTANGVETGQQLTSTNATTTQIVPGTYRGDVVLTVDQQNLFAWQGLNSPSGRRCTSTRAASSGPSPCPPR